MSGNDFRNSQALSRRQKIVSDDDDVISDRAFQTRGPATGKARLPTVESLTGDTDFSFVRMLQGFPEAVVL